MYYCRDCKNVIEGSDIRYIWEKNEFWGATHIDNVAICPYCKSENIQNINNHPRCSSCQESYLTYHIDD